MKHLRARSRIYRTSITSPRQCADRRRAMEWEGRKEERERERDRRTDIQRDRHAVSAAIMSCVSAAAAAAVTSWSTSAPIQLRLAPPARTISPSVRPSVDRRRVVRSRLARWRTNGNYCVILWPLEHDLKRNVKVDVSSTVLQRMIKTI